MLVHFVPSSATFLDMFFDGDLQSGIALALRDSKYVACFVKGVLLMMFRPMSWLTSLIKARTTRALHGRMSILKTSKLPLLLLQKR